MSMNTDHILKLAEIIREVDGGNRLGAAALAEAILSHPGNRRSPAIEPEVPTEEEMNDLFWKHSSTIGDGGCGPGVGLAFEDAPALICEALARWGRPAVEPEANGQT
jgi:hypothetical protein